MGTWMQIQFCKIRDELLVGTRYFTSEWAQLVEVRTGAICLPFQRANVDDTVA